MSDEQQEKLVSQMSAHNTQQLKDFFNDAAIEGDWQLVYAASYNGCIISLPAKEGGHVRLRIAAKFRHEYPYLELRSERMEKAGSPQAATEAEAPTDEEAAGEDDGDEDAE